MHNEMRITSSALLHTRRHIDSIEEWSQAASKAFYPVHCSTESRPFRGTIQSGVLDTINLAQLQGSPLEISRSAQHIEKGAKDVYHIQFQLTGSASLRQCGQEAFLKPGDFVICKSNAPYHLSLIGNYSQVVLTIEQHYLDELLSGFSTCIGRTMDGKHAVNAVLVDFVLSLTRHCSELDPKSQQRLRSTCIDLLITALKSQQNGGSRQAGGAQAEHLRRIKQFIELHLTDSQLCPELIARSEGISTRYLHMLFKKGGISVSRYIHLRRVHACARQLKDPAETNRSTTDIALDSGFNDVSHFYRCFKSVYGMTPREYRLNA